MRKVPAALAAHLDAGVTTMCRCWRVTRRDGVAIGVTDHDAALSFEGLEFAPEGGFAASAVESRLGLAASDGEIAGALSSDAIEAAALEAGLFDGARVETFWVNWADPSMRIRLSVAEIGEVRRGAAAFEAELRGPAAKLDVPIGRTYQPSCDADLGDARCGVALVAAGMTATGAVIATSPPRRLLASGLAGFAEGWFDGGRLAWSSGANAGSAVEIRSVRTAEGGAAVELRFDPAFPPAAGDAFSVSAGCDKSWTTCRAKFGNGANFRGFRAMPGNDWIAAPPADGERHDGGSRA